MPSFSYNKERNTFGFNISEEVSFNLEAVLWDMVDNYISARRMGLKPGFTRRYLTNFKERIRGPEALVLKDFLPTEVVEKLIELFVSNFEKNNFSLKITHRVVKDLGDYSFKSLNTILGPFFSEEMKKFKEEEKSKTRKVTEEERKAVNDCNKALAALGYAVKSAQDGLKLTTIGEKK